MSDSKKGKKDEITFVFVLVVLGINFLIYQLSETAGWLFFGFFGMWFLGYGLYKIAKIFWPNL